jgi:hypothetical protein
MPCAYSKHKAGEQGSDNLVSLGNVGELCRPCRVLIRKVLTTQNDAIVDSNIQGYLEDYIRMYVVLSSETIFQDKIARFGNAIAADRRGRRRGLSYHLKRFETRCHFPDIEVIPTGVLSFDEFYDMIARGVMWKDVGAGLNHGLYAHRLQWHVLLAVITSDFTVARAAGWDHGGYDLFVSMGEQGRQFNIWGKMFDNSGTNCFRAPEYVEGNISVPTVSRRIDDKYAKYHAAFKNIEKYAFDKARIRATDDAGKIDMDLLKSANFEITDAVWATYYFGRRNIRAALPEDRTEYRGFSEAYLRRARDQPWANDRSKRFAPRNITIEHKTVRLQSQIMPSAEQIRALRRASAATLNTA